jgi:hypothetical protein
LCMDMLSVASSIYLHSCTVVHWHSIDVVVEDQFISVDSAVLHPTR